MKFQTWSVVKNYDAVDADARILDNGAEAELNLTHYSLARFKARLDSVEGGMRYRFGYESQLGDGVSMQIVCTILDREGKPLFRVHANAGETVLAPEGAACAELDLCMFGFTGGAGRVTDVFMEKLRLSWSRAMKNPLSREIFASARSGSTLRLRRALIWRSCLKHTTPAASRGSALGKGQPAWTSLQ